MALTDAGDPEGDLSDPPGDPTPGRVVERYTYDPYGRTVIETWDQSLGGGSGGFVVRGSGLTAIGSAGGSHFGNPFAWTGQRYDAGVGLYHFLFRSYSPEFGRWLQRDPAGYVDGPNLLEYVRSMPTGLVDPLGLDACKVYRNRLNRARSDLAKVYSKIAAHQLARDAIRERILNRIETIERRKLDLLLNPGGQPWTKPGDDCNRGTSQRGHLRLVLEDLKRNREDEIKIWGKENDIRRLRLERDRINRGISDASKELAACEAGERWKKAGRVAKRAAGGVARKVPFVNIALFAMDVSDEGLGTAVDNVIWPLGDIYRALQPPPGGVPPSDAPRPGGVESWNYPCLEC